jgi:hypothetical protein
MPPFIFPIPPRDSFFRRHIAIIRTAEFTLSATFAGGAWFAGGDMFLVIPGLVIAWIFACAGFMASKLATMATFAWCIFAAAVFVGEAGVLYWHFHSTNLNSLPHEKFPPARPPEANPPAPNVSPKPPEPKQSQPQLQSKNSQVIYRCEHQQKTPRELEKATAAYKHEMQILGDTFGYSTVVTPVLGGTRVEVTPRTPELRQSMSPVTKYSIQIRYLDDRTIVVYAPEVDPAALENNFLLQFSLAMMVPPGSVTDMQVRNLMTRLPGVKADTCELF